MPWSASPARWRARRRWPVSFDRFWDGLQRRQGKQEGNRAMIDALRLGRAFGYAELAVAIENSLEYGCFNVDTVRLLLPGDGRRRSKWACCDAMIGHNRRWRITISCCRRAQPVR